MSAAAVPFDADVRRKVRFATLWYIIMGASGPFTLIYLPSKIIAAGDAATTVASLRAHELLFRTGIVASLAGQAAFVLTALALQSLLEHVDRGQARTMVAFVVACVPVSFVNAVFEAGALVVTGGADYLKVFEPAQLEALAMAFLQLSSKGTAVAQVFWGLWLFPLGILIFRSRFVPKVLGLFEIAAGLGYLIDTALYFLAPGLRGPLGPALNILLFGELPFMAWLVWASVRPVSRKPVPQPA